MGKWETRPLGELSFVVTKGTTPQTLGRQYKVDGIPFLRAENLQGDHVVIDSDTLRIDTETHCLLRRSVIYQNDILLSIAGTIGRAAIVSDGMPEMNCNQAVAIVRLKPDQILPAFLLLWLKSSDAQSQISGAQVTQTVSNLSLGQIKNLSFPVPPLSEQKRIVRLLDEADALYKLRSQADRRTADLIPALFHEMFGDPIRNEMRWEVYPVSSFVSELYGGKNVNPAGADEAAGRFRVLKISAVTLGDFRPEESKPVPAGYEPPPQHIIGVGDLLFSRANTTELVAATSYVFETPPNLLLPDKLWRFVWKEPRSVEPIYIWWLFQAPSIRREFGRRATGTGGSMKNISKPKVMSLEVPVPPMVLQREFAWRVTEIRALEVEQSKGHSRLDDLFQSMLHRAFSGEL